MLVYSKRTLLVHKVTLEIKVGLHLKLKRSHNEQCMLHQWNTKIAKNEVVKIALKTDLMLRSLITLGFVPESHYIYMMHYEQHDRSVLSQCQSTPRCSQISGSSQHYLPFGHASLMQKDIQRCRSSPVIQGFFILRSIQECHYQL